MIVAIIAGIVILITIGVSIYANHGHSRSNISEFLVGGRSFPAWLVFFLAVGEVYSIGTLLGFPGGIYAKGASYGVWFIGYILLAYVFGYFWAPLIWRAGMEDWQAISANQTIMAKRVAVAIGRAKPATPLDGKFGRTI